MKTIKNQIIELEQSKWDYYNDYSTRKLENPFGGDNITQIEFIEKYFKRSGKSFILDSFPIPLKKIKKADHTNSIFFLGVILYDKLMINEVSVKNSVFNITRPLGYKEFPFIWFLTCLFHDFGMGIEHDESLLNKICDIDSLKKELEIKHCLLEKRVKGVNKNLFDNIRHYFAFRRYAHRKLDHGIVAGLFFYDKLVRNRIVKEPQSNDNLIWDSSLEDHYALTASAIATHNMWFPNWRTASEYIKFDMMSLVNIDPISFKDFPLLYLLGIVDTIDPIKTFSSEFSSDYILGNLFLEVSGNILKICNKEESKLDFKKMHKKSENFNDWLNVTVVKKENELEVRMK